MTMQTGKVPEGRLCLSVAVLDEGDDALCELVGGGELASV
jgi:hypothetical protein